MILCQSIDYQCLFSIFVSSYIGRYEWVNKITKPLGKHKILTINQIETSICLDSAKMANMVNRINMNNVVVIQAWSSPVMAANNNIK